MIPLRTVILRSLSRTNGVGSFGRCPEIEELRDEGVIEWIRQEDDGEVRVRLTAKGKAQSDD